MAKKAILADDDQELRETLGDYVKELGFELTLCGGGQEVLSALESGDYDLVIADHKMPQMTGYDLLIKVAEIQPNIGLVLFTGFSADLQMTAGQQKKIFVLNKPAGFEQVKNAIQTVLG